MSANPLNVPRLTTADLIRAVVADSAPASPAVKVAAARAAARVMTPRERAEVARMYQARLDAIAHQVNAMRLAVEGDGAPQLQIQPKKRKGRK